MEFDFIDKYKLVIERVGKRYKVVLLDPVRKVIPIRVFGSVFWIGWARKKQFVAELAEKVGCSPNNLVAPLEAIGAEIELKGRRILEPQRPPKKTEPSKEAVDESLLNDEGKFEFVARKVAGLITDKHRFVTHRQSHVIWVYRNGFYADDGEEVIREEVRTLLGDDATEAWVNETVRHIEETTYTDPKKFEAPAHLVNVKNCTLNIQTGEPISHSPETIFTNELPIDYDPNADCPAIKKFLAEILTPDDIPVMQEIVGYCLMRNYKFAKAVMLLGEGSNGKSTLLNLIAALLGEENVATPALQDLIEDRFSRAELFGKLANIHADLSNIKLRQTGIFKLLTGQDLVYAQVKHKNPFKFKNYAKLLYSANELPRTYDTSEAFWRRWIIINFPNVFPEGDPKTDPNILGKLTTPREFSGFLNYALEGLKRLLVQGVFSQSKTGKDIEREWITRTDSLRAFIMRHATRDPKYIVTKDSFYTAYQDFCVENEVAPVEKALVGRRLPVLLPGVYDFYPIVGDKQRKCWKGIKLTDAKYGKYNMREMKDISSFMSVLGEKKVYSKNSVNSVKESPEDPHISHIQEEGGGRNGVETAEHWDMAGKTESQQDNIRRVMVIIGDLEGQYDGAAPVEEIKRIAESKGIKRSFVEELIEQEKMRGHLYEPKEGMITRAVK